MLGWLNGVGEPTLTHARVAIDTACWYNKSTGVGEGCGRNMTCNYWSWAVAPPSMLSWALGIVPYKDSYISSNKPDSRGPGACVGNSCLFKNATEPYPWVHALASALSAGPNQIGDKINASDIELIVKTCREDGLLLKPDRPATPIDSYWSVRAFGAAAAGPKGELWTTETTIDGLTWMYGTFRHFPAQFPPF